MVAGEWEGDVINPCELEIEPHTYPACGCCNQAKPEAMVTFTAHGWCFVMPRGSDDFCGETGLWGTFHMTICRDCALAIAERLG